MRFPAFQPRPPVVSPLQPVADYDFQFEQLAIRKVLPERGYFLLVAIFVNKYSQSGGRQAANVSRTEEVQHVPTLVETMCAKRYTQINDSQVGHLNFKKQGEHLSRTFIRQRSYRSMAHMNWTDPFGCMTLRLLRPAHMEMGAGSILS
jgi:hypothetical protein